MSADKAEMEIFRRRLLDVMAEKRMSQSDLARAIWGNTTDNRGRTVAANRDRISNYCNGKQYPEPETLIKLAQALSVPVERLNTRGGRARSRPSSVSQPWRANPATGYYKSTKPSRWAPR
jgi:transcriptional regulator with XRE-family HTH domain